MRGNSLAMRAEGDMVLTPEPLEVRADYVEVKETKETINMSKYHNRIKELEKEKAEGERKQL